MSDRHLILIMPGVASQSESMSVLRELPAGTREMAARSKIVRLSARPLTSELEWLGLPHDAADVPDGPLTVALIGAEPPARSIRFRLELLSLDDDHRLSHPEPPASIEELQVIGDALVRLQRKRAIPVTGPAGPFGLVWEDGSIDLHCSRPQDCEGKLMREVLPEGDGESLLRTWIDDSVNLLSELELNRRRLGEGQPQLNVAWPYGPGFAVQLPNLALRRRLMAGYSARSWRLEALTRLSAYRWLGGGAVGNEYRLEYGQIVQHTERGEPVVLVLESATHVVNDHGLERLAWLIAELDRQLFGPLVRLASPQTRIRIDWLLPGIEHSRAHPMGLAMAYDSMREQESLLPLDERILDDLRVPTYPVWEIVDGVLRASVD